MRDFPKIAKTQDAVLKPDEFFKITILIVKGKGV